MPHAKMTGPGGTPITSKQPGVIVLPLSLENDNYVNGTLKAIVEEALDKFQKVIIVPGDTLRWRYHIAEAVEELLIMKEDEVATNLLAKAYERNKTQQTGDFVDHISALAAADTTNLGPILINANKIKEKAIEIAQRVGNEWVQSRSETFKLRKTYGKRLVTYSWADCESQSQNELAELQKIFDEGKALYKGDDAVGKASWKAKFYEQIQADAKMFIKRRQDNKKLPLVISHSEMRIHRFDGIDYLLREHAVFLHWAKQTKPLEIGYFGYAGSFPDTFAVLQEQLFPDKLLRIKITTQRSPRADRRTDELALAHQLSSGTSSVQSSATSSYTGSATSSDVDPVTASPSTSTTRSMLHALKPAHSAGNGVVPMQTEHDPEMLPTQERTTTARTAHALSSGVKPADMIFAQLMGAVAETQAADAEATAAKQRAAMNALALQLLHCDNEKYRTFAARQLGLHSDEQEQGLSYSEVPTTTTYLYPNGSSSSHRPK